MSVDGPRDSAATPGQGLVLSVESAVSRHWLESMRRDGLLVAVGPDHYLRADAAQWPAARLLALRAALPPGSVAGLSTAVWAMGGPPCQSNHDRVHVSAIVRPHSMARNALGLTVYRSPLDLDDVREVAGTPITGDARTLADLALLGTADDDSSLAWLLENRRVAVPAAVAVLRRRGRAAGVRRAATVLRLVSAGAREPLAQVPPARSR